MLEAAYACLFTGQAGSQFNLGIRTSWFWGSGAGWEDFALAEHRNGTPGTLHQENERNSDVHDGRRNQSFQRGPAILNKYIGSNLFLRPTQDLSGDLFQPGMLGVYRSNEWFSRL